MSMEHQNELFKEFDRKKGNIEKIAAKITEKRKRLSMNVPLENIVFGAIVVMMCVVTAFALGVERGKRLKEASIPQIELSPIEVSKVSREADVLPVQAKVEPTPEPVKPQYTIQLISYKYEKRALREIKQLKNKKINAILRKSEKWYQICAGNYKNMDEARVALKEFKKKYKGCFIKNL